MMFTYEWELTKSPAGAWQWVAKDVKPEHMIPDAHVPGRLAAPIMTTADLSLRHDPIMAPVARRFHQDQEAFARPLPKLGSSSRTAISDRMVFIWGLRSRRGWRFGKTQSQQSIML